MSIYEDDEPGFEDDELLLADGDEDDELLSLDDDEFSLADDE